MTMKQIVVGIRIDSSLDPGDDRLTSRHTTMILVTVMFD